MRTNWKWATTTGVGAIAFTLTSGAAGAFFPPLPLATPDPVTIVSPPPVAPILVVPTITPPILVEPVKPLPPVVVPVVPPPPFVPPVSPPNVPQTVPPVCTCPVTPQTVPEPATVLSGLIGLSVVAAGTIRRRRQAGADLTA